MFKLEIQGKKEPIFCESKENLLQVLLRENIPVDNSCNGNGTCGKCRVKINGQTVLACQIDVESDMTIETLHEEVNSVVMTDGYRPAIQRDEGQTGYGVAVDIGTTTVVATLVDLSTGEELYSVSGINAQKQFGLDVLTRITYEFQQEEEGIRQLQKAIIGQLNQFLKELRGKQRIDKEEIKSIAVAANCTMMHMFLGEDARSIGVAPYKPNILEALTMKACEVGLEAASETILYTLPHVSGYIGADIVAGAYVCKLQDETRNVLFLDIGTNGEMVLASRGRLYSCSCAAGPALEGMNISAGMRAQDGAIEDLTIDERGVTVKTIGNVKAKGLCGSGILAAVSQLLESGLVKKTGAFVKLESLKEDDYRRGLIDLDIDGKKRRLLLPEGLFVTQDDVRQVQLAKGAILSGFMALLREANLTVEELDQVIIAGQFGAHLPEKALLSCTIVPREVKGKLSYVGNSSKTGAVMSLLSSKCREEMEILAKKINYMELAETENYEMLFTTCMSF